MSVIRTLSTSRDLQDRDRERAELEKGFVQCDQKLNDLVSQHNNDLYHVCLFACVCYPLTQPNNAHYYLP